MTTETHIRQDAAYKILGSIQQISEILQLVIAATYLADQDPARQLLIARLRQIDHGLATLDMFEP